MNVTIDDLKRVGKNCISKLFNGNESNTVIVAHPDKVKDLAESFSKDAGIFFFISPYELTLALLYFHYRSEGRDFETFKSVDKATASLK